MDAKLTRKRIALVFAGVAVVTAGTVGGAASFGSGDDDAQDRPIPASDLERAKQAALGETGGGVVTATEIDDEESKYEVEVTLEDGTRVDVQLDEGFEVVGTERDGTRDDTGGAEN